MQAGKPWVPGTSGCLSTGGVPIVKPWPQTLSLKTQTKGPWADTKILWATTTCTLHPITFDYCLKALTRQPFAHYYAAASTLTYSRLHTTMQPLAQYHAAACTIPYICLHTTMQPLAHYHADRRPKYPLVLGRCSKSRWKGKDMG